jgi:hypothetical protein
MHQTNQRWACLENLATEVTVAGMIDNSLRNSSSVRSGLLDRSSGPPRRIVDDVPIQIVNPVAPGLCPSAAADPAVVEYARASTARSPGIAAVVSRAARKMSAVM